MSLALLTERATMRVSAYAWNDTAAPERAGADTLLKGASIEVIPRTATKAEDFRSLLMEGTRVYIAHIDGTPIGEMVATAKRIRAEGFAVMPHLPARSIANMGMLREWVSRYRDVGVDEMLVCRRPIAARWRTVELRRDPGEWRIGGLLAIMLPAIRRETMTWTPMAGRNVWTRP